jgi:hypothetical protein
MKEQMIRLIRDGEIVGYEVKHYSDSYGKVITRRSKSLTDWSDCLSEDDENFNKDFIHDSINLSFIKKVKEQQKLFGVANDGRKKHG